MGVVPPYRKLVMGREIKGTETCDLVMTRFRYSPDDWLKNVISYT